MTKPSLPFYLAALIGHIASVLAVYTQIDSPGLLVGMIVLSVIGTAFSYQLRRHNRAPEHLLGIALPILILVFLLALLFAGKPSAPVAFIGNGHIALVVALLWSATVSFFLLWNNETVVFTAVWPLAVIGLMGTMNVNPELIISFAVYFFAAIFLLVHHAVIGNGSRRGSEAGRRASPEDNATLLRIHALVAAGAWVLAVVLGFSVAIPVQMVGRNISLMEMLKRLSPTATPNRAGQNGGRLSFSSREFRVGLGPVTSGTEEVLRVQTPRPHYWRGRTFFRYSAAGEAGNVWDNGTSGDGVEFPLPDGTTLASHAGAVLPSRDSTGEGRFELPHLPDMGQKPQKVTRETHVFTSRNGSIESLYHAAEPQVISGYFTEIIRRFDGTLRSNGNNAPITLGNSEAQYTIEADISAATPDDLAKSGTNYPAFIKQLYLVPLGGGDGPLLAEAIGTAKDPYAQAEAIRRFIGQRCVYTLDARAVPANRDAVDFFLNESREGYCDLYATAMAVMARQAGLPSRVVTGFLTGDADPDRAGQYILRDKDRHAWCEIYFVGHGWIPFDATQDTSSALDTQAVVTQPLKKKNFWEQLQESGKIPVIFLSLGGLGIVFVVFNELRGRRFRLTGGAATAPIIEHRTRAILQHYRQAMKATTRKGVPRPHYQTAREHLLLVGNALGSDAQNALTPLVSLVEQALYSPQTLSQSDIETAQKSGDLLRTVLKAQKKKQ
jgi:Transglutaminase-like superfamily/TgpA N-terminal domain/Domain of unknown function (DUF4129)